MSKTLICELAVVACLLGGGAVARNAHPTRTNAAPDRRLALDGAFRDGLFIGRLTAESGRASRPPIGRWSSDSDQASFLAGYQRGYNGVLPHSPNKTEQSERPERTGDFI